MNDLRLWANFYYNMGFNVTHIIPKQNEGKAKNPYKSATNDRYKIANIRQPISELQNLNWDDSEGIGVVLGFNNIRALDFDFINNNGVSRIYPLQPPDYTEKHYFKNNDTFLQYTLYLLGLPKKYEWVIKTPSGGFHIIFYAPYHKFALKENLTKAFTPNGLVHDSIGLEHIELRWDKHLVLPPSINDNGINYEFYYKKIPKHYPQELSLQDIKSLLDELCYDEYDINKTGYNLYRSGHYDNNDEEAIQYYEEGEFLDFSPVYFRLEKNEDLNNIPND